MGFLGLFGGMMETLTTFQIARMLSVDISTVIDWIDSGKLKAYRTPGGHRRVNPSDLLKFLKKYKMPIPAVAVGLPSNEKSSHSNATATKILIVDDNEDILEFISRAIKKFCKNTKIETITEGFIAGKRIAEFKPDLLILDIKLPGMDGFEVLKHLKGSGRVSLPYNKVTSQLHIKNLKILAITAYPSKETKEKILKAGADDYLVKPFTVEQLKEKIENLIY